MLSKIIPSVRAKFLTIYKQTKDDLEKLSANELSDLAHMAEENKTSQQYSTRAAAEIVAAACQIIQEKKTN
jgi:hypothetical protein